MNREQQQDKVNDFLIDYLGENDFLKGCKKYLDEKGKLTRKQYDCLIRLLLSEELNNSETIGS